MVSDELFFQGVKGIFPEEAVEGVGNFITE
jgi:hypothetical protein